MAVVAVDGAAGGPVSGPAGAGSDLGARARAAATSGLALLGVVLALLLLPPVPDPVRTTASSLGLLLGGVAAGVCCALRARALAGTPGARAWGLVAAAAAVAVTGNLWVALVGGDAVDEPSLVSNVSIAVALVLSIVALAMLAGANAGRTRPDRVVVLLDGFVVGGALLILVSAVVFPDLVSAAPGDPVAQVTSLAFPVLDVALASIAVLLLLRAPREQRLALAMVALGFVTYGISDLAYAVGTARGTFDFGTPADLGWIVGYLLVAAAALTPPPVPGQAAAPESGMLPTLSSAVVLGLTVVAVVSQATLLPAGTMGRLETGLLVLVVTAAGARQVLLTHDNTVLRRALERRVVEQTVDLSRMVRQQEALLTSVGEGIYGVDTEGRITFVNPVGARLLGRRAEDLTGRSAHELFHVAEDGDVDHPWSRCSVHRAIVDALETTLEETYRRADGQVVPVESTAAPLFDETEVRGAVVVFRDVTQRREVDRMKNEFLSVVSHELRTPLTAILGSLELVSSGQLGALPAPVEQLVGVASRSSQRLSRLINDLLDAERIESGSQPMRLSTVDAAPLVVNAVQQVQGMATSYGVQVTTGTLRGRLTVDQDQVVQTLVNLLGNAVKFSPAGSVVRAEAHVVGAHVHLQVHDTGRGIPADKLETIFERFEQVDSSDTRDLGGTGLGLAISRSIVERHGGRIWATSELGVGTTMTVSLPAARRRGKDGQGQKIVVHDEDPRVVETYLSVLGVSGYRPVGVVDPDAVMAVLDRERPALLLLDASPGTSGAQVLGRVADDPLHSRLAILAVTSAAAPGAGPAPAEDGDSDTGDDAGDDTDERGWSLAPVGADHLVATVTGTMDLIAPAGSVVLVEDDEDLARRVGTRLEQAGLQVQRAGSTTELAELALERPDLVLLDLVLPDGQGSAVVADLRRRGLLGGTPVVLYTARPSAVARRPRPDADEVRAAVLALVAASTSTAGRDEPAVPPTSLPRPPTPVLPRSLAVPERALDPR